MKKINTFCIHTEKGIILPILIFILLAVGLVATVYLIGKETIFKSKATSDGPTLTLSENVSATKDVPVNIDVTIMPDGKEVYGVDVIATFDKGSLTLTDVQLHSTILDVSFPQKDNNVLDKEKVIQKANSSGSIEFGLLCWQNGSCKKGLGVNQSIATLKFTPLKDTVSKIFLSFNPSNKANTKDTNLIGANGADILNTVKNSTVTISASAGTPTSTPASTPIPTLIPTPIPAPIPSPLSPSPSPSPSVLSREVSGTIYVSDNAHPYSGSFSIGSNEGGTVSTNPLTGVYRVSGLPSTPSNNSYYQFWFPIPEGYQVSSTPWAGPSCGGLPQYQFPCRGHGTLYGSVTLSTFGSNNSVSGQDIYLQAL